MDLNLVELAEEAELAALNAGCPRASCGVAAMNHFGEVICAWNDHIGDQECIVEDDHCVSSLHAEAGLVCKAAFQGIKLLGATVMSSQRPCQRCLMTMRKAGILKVYFIHDYHSTKHSAEYCSPKLMQEMGVEQYHKPV